MSKFAYHTDLDIAGTFTYDADGKAYFHPVTDQVRSNTGIISSLEVARDVLLMAAEIIPLLIRLWIMVFGNKQQKKVAAQHHRAAAKIRQAKRKVK